jgi:hypothetical protein
MADGRYKLSIQMFTQREGTVLGLTLLLTAFAPPIFAQCPSPYLNEADAMQRARPCECHPGIEQIQNFLDDTTNELNAWQQVQDEMKQQTMTVEQARARFNQLHANQLNNNLFGCAPAGVVGRGSGRFFCKPCVRQDAVDCFCDVIVASIIMHETLHCAYNGYFGNAFQGAAKQLANSEVEAHQAQQQYLQQALKDLKNSPKCKPKQSYYPAPQKGGVGQPAIANAANRVGQYAATID